MGLHPSTAQRQASWSRSQTRTALPSVSVVPGPLRLGIFEGAYTCVFPFPTT